MSYLNLPTVGMLARAAMLVVFVLSLSAQALTRRRKNVGQTKSTYYSMVNALYQRRY